MSPIFEYLCPNCGLIEVLVMPGEKEITLCPQCEEQGNKNKVTKALSASALSFKGSGFYITDYTSKSGSASEGRSGESGGEGNSNAKKNDASKLEQKSTSESTPTKTGETGSKVESGKSGKKPESKKKN